MYIEQGENTVLLKAAHSESSVGSDKRLHVRYTLVLDEFTSRDLL